ncbi:hypothetical protein ACFVGM_08700 [Kitasatospora purpeofusca]|uniref:hypothetical protein n=1 Tax=Kitasatospora purpeofusca TaxID=67352 RepID=UPI0036BA73D2
MTGIGDLTWDTLESYGFEREERPEGFVAPLADITALSSAGIAQLLAHYTEWANYAAYRLSDAESRQEEAARGLKVLTNQAALRATGEKTVAGRRAAASLDAEVQEAEEEAAQYAALVRSLKMLHENTLRRASVVSRELSRRQAEAQYVARESKWGAA